MSHIYDALKKSHGGEPPQPPGPGEPPPPGAPPIPPPVVQAGEPPRNVQPVHRLNGELLDEPRPELLRQLDSLRQNVDVMLGRAPRRVIGLTAAVPDEGASTLAVHFAYLLARVGERRTLLVDADMGRSNRGLSEAAGEREGLSELLRRELPLESIILGTSEHNLHFLPAGLDRVHQAASVGSGLLRPLFDALGHYYDVVVVDIAPVLDHPEAPYIAAACDGVALVVRAHRTRRETAQRALGELNFSRCRILGTILNGQKGKLTGFQRDRD